MKLKITAHPNSKKPRITTDLLKNVHVYIREPASENRANKAIIDALSVYYSVPKTAVKLIHGAKSKNKLFEIDIDTKQVLK